MESVPSGVSKWPRQTYRLALAAVTLLVFVACAYSGQGCAGFWPAFWIVLIGPLRLAPPIGALLWLAFAVTLLVRQDLVSIVFFIIVMPFWWLMAWGCIGIASG